MLFLTHLAINLDFITYGVIFKKQMVEIEVYSKKKDKLRQPAADWLPSTPFLMGVSGPSMSGKGVLIQNIIMNPNLYHDQKGDSVFDEIHIWTGSAKLDVNLEKVKRWAEDFLKQDPEKNIPIHDGLIKKR